MLRFYVAIRQVLLLLAQLFHLFTAEERKFNVALKSLRNMKNLNTQFLKITAIIIITLFMSSTIFAQVKQDTSARDTSNQQQTYPLEQNQRADSKDYDKGVDYSETIDQNELPQEVNNSLEELYPAHAISKVFKGEDDSFKIKVKNALCYPKI